MLTRLIDEALEAITRCSTRVPRLAACFQPGRPERSALDELSAALHKAEEALKGGWRADRGAEL